MSESDDLIQIDKMSVDQAAGAFVMIAGAIGSLLLVIWQSKCHCKVNLCYIFQCERRPPNEEEMKSLKDQSKKLKDMKKKEDKILEKEEEILEEQRTPRLIPKTSSQGSSIGKPILEVEPEPQFESPEIDKLV
jgi:hypothetical protein